MSIDAVGGAGHQCDIVLSGGDGQIVHLMGEDDVDLLELGGQNLIEDGDGQGIGDDEVVEVGEES